MPIAIAWTKMLPMAVASTGPAKTGSPVASAANWHSTVILGTAADNIDLRNFPAADFLDLVLHVAVVQRQTFQD